MCKLHVVPVFIKPFVGVVTPTPFIAGRGPPLYPTLFNKVMSKLLILRLITWVLPKKTGKPSGCCEGEKRPPFILKKNIDYLEVQDTVGNWLVM